MMGGGVGGDEDGCGRQHEARETSAHRSLGLRGGRVEGVWLWTNKDILLPTGESSRNGHVGKNNTESV